MESKADVKSIMARFQASEATSEASSTLPGRAKPPLQPTLSGPNIPPKKPVLETLSGSAITIPPKPTLKHTEAHELNKTKPLLSKFSNAHVGAGDKPGNVQKVPQKPSVPKPPEIKPPGLKPPASKPALGSTLSDSKPAIPKPSPAVRPSWVKEDAGGGETGPTPPKVPPSQQKPTSSISKLRQQNEAAASKPFLPNAAPKPPSNFKEAQSIFSKETAGLEQPDGGGKAPPTATGSTPPPKPLASKKPSLKKPPPQVSSSNGDTPAGPRRNPLVNVFALGPAPAKPNRPPTVNLEPFRRGAEASGDGPSKPTVPAPLTSYPGNHSNHSTPLQPPPPPALPSLPPRHLGSEIQQEDFYDDIDDLSSAPPPPLPPAAGHPSQKAKVKEKNDHEDQDPDKQWETADQNLDRDKKRLEAEKKEREARKKFKLVGPLETVHSVKAVLDYRGSKTDLALKQGEDLDIIRVQGNPEGRWLGRNQDGSIGYVKISSVQIDFNSLKRCTVEQTGEPEVYDDVAPDVSAIKGPRVVLPPLPGEDGEIYDDVVDPNLEVSDSDAEASPAKPHSFLRMFEWRRRTFSNKEVAPPSQFTTEGRSDQAAAAIDEEIYDDVDSQAQPPPPPLSSLPGFKFMNKAAEVDPKKQKKMEKEEKEFRKKFKVCLLLYPKSRHRHIMSHLEQAEASPQQKKANRCSERARFLNLCQYEGEIRVLYQVTIVPTLTNKKWASKELAVKAGERVDVIAKATDNRLLCRGEEGKCDRLRFHQSRHHGRQ
ncbi:FYN-binding protein 1 isoform X2 [Takifugu flavidus]|uniref:FYN-binding protein 1 isoform X2 n=1 Tax=Takifugu flavidus TaxID=433684 RepID=UPI0025448F23|nr:FYN-binding protein 1 isoform X2 [Takifugu flavidus]